MFNTAIPGDVMGPNLEYLLDDAETVQVSGIALLKMLRHARSGVPVEVMGLLLGTFIDRYTVHVTDVFSTPQHAQSNMVESTQEDKIVEYKNKLSKVGRNENVIGWYHSHPGWDVFLSDMDQSSQINWQRLGHRNVAIVIDPIKSVRGKVYIGAFRCNGSEARLTSSCIYMECPKVRRLTLTGQERYYRMPVTFKLTEFERSLLIALDRPSWSAGFDIKPFKGKSAKDSKRIKEVTNALKDYRKEILEEVNITPQQALTRHVGTYDPKEFVKSRSSVMSSNESSNLFRINLDVATF